MTKRMSKRFTWEEIARHNTETDCWVAIYGTVYDVTKFLTHHPGGVKAFMQVAGGDATHAFKNYHKHSAKALGKYGSRLVIGRLAKGEVKSPSTSGTFLSCGTPPGRQSPPLAQFPADDAKGYPAKHPSSISPPSLLSRAKNGLVSLTADIAGLGLRALSNFVVEPALAVDRFIRPIRGIPKNEDGSPTKVAIVGAGCSGLSAAWLLQQTEGFDYTVFEAQPRVGGHAYTIDYKGKDGKHINIDMGFIFGGWYTYSNLLEMMKSIGAETIDSELSTMADVDGYRYASDTAGICDSHGQGRKKLKEWMHPDGRSECVRFQALCERFYENPLFNLLPFRIFLDIYGFSWDFRNLYLKPTLVLLFVGEHMVFDMPSRLIFNMFAGNNKQADLIHGHPCFTIKGGTRDWVDKLVKVLAPKSVKLNTPVREVTRITEKNGKPKVLLRTDKGLEVFDHVLFSCGAKAAALCLQNQSALEKYIFKQIRYETAAVLVLHRDHTFLTQFTEGNEASRKHLRNFNYRAVKGEPQCEVTGLMHEISQQEPTTDAPPFSEEFQKEIPVLTLNPLRKPKAEILHEKYCVFHQEDLWHLLITRVLLPQIQGSGNVWYGATWTNWIGHASGIDAGMVIATRLGANMAIKSETARDVYFDMAARDMLGHRFDWRRSVRAERPILRAAL